MEINNEKKEEFIKASVGRIVDWAKSVGIEISGWQLTALYSELKTMYETGHRHCNEIWEEYMEDARIERDLSERD